MSIDDDALATPADEQDGPAVPESREPAAIAGKPSDEELKAAYWKGFQEASMCGADASWLAGLREVARLGQQVQPQPAAIPPPTRRQLMMLASDMGMASIDEAVKFALAVIARWGRPATQPAPLEGEVGEGLEPTHEQICQWINANPVLRPESTGGPMIRVGTDWLAAFADAARWGARFHTTAPAVVPIPVSERLPGEGDCDVEGRCWLLTVEDDYPQWRLHSVEGHQPGGRMIWVPVDRTPGVMVDAFYVSHWLPAHALPLPSGEVEG